MVASSYGHGIFRNPENDIVFITKMTRTAFDNEASHSRIGGVAVRYVPAGATKATLNRATALARRKATTRLRRPIKV